MLTVLCVFAALGMGENTATAAEGIRAQAAAESKAEKLADVIKGAAAYSGCDQLPLLEKPKCYREFAEKAIKVGAGIGLFGYVIHQGHKDTTEHFGSLKKEVAGLNNLKDVLKQDPRKITDEEYRKKVVVQLRTALTGAEADIEKALKDVLQIIETVVAMVTVTLLLLQLILVLAKIVGNPENQKAFNSIAANLRGISKDLDDINAGLAQMNKALDGMNEGLDLTNAALDRMNKGIDQANEGMDEMNRGIAQANKGMDAANKGISEANKAMTVTNKHVGGLKTAAGKLREVPGIDFDFSHIGETWDSGSSGLDEAEQQRRMSLLLSLLPGIGDGKGIVEAVVGKDLATGDHLSAYDRALGSLAVLRWLKAGGKALTADDVRNARKGEEAISCNSFPAGTPVLLANGSRVPIEQVQAGDEVLATDAGGETELTLPRPVLSTAVTSQYTDKTFTRLTIADEVGGSDTVTSTGNHLYWVPSRNEWVRADELATGDRLRTAEGSFLTVQETTRLAGRLTTYDIDVSGIDSYYVGVGNHTVLVHNCTDLARANSLFPGLAHTVDEHIDVTKEQMQALAINKTNKRGRPTPNSRWTNQATAQQVVDHAVAQNEKRIQDWLRKGGVGPLPLKGTYTQKSSLGDTMTHEGKYSQTGNRYVVVLTAKKGHKPGGYYISTAYPE
ncbi:RNase A-like domain-containing protein [Streptomyces spiramyceticus]|uniref:RNase A-like domain-containing protein n=1 Tax=Streptomyces spiramyceticus TaxID=299717 RepID=UPI00237BC27B|nr:RNase A-like domain-containing protein [Streptomyces spiramyceticus]